MKAHLRRWLWEPLLAQLRQRLSPERLAWTVAVGLALFLTPLFRAEARRWEARPA